jgi:hypothetical protein
VWYSCACLSHKIADHARGSFAGRLGSYVSTTFVPIDENRTQGVLLGGIFGVGGFYGISMLRRPGEFAAVVI